MFKRIILTAAGLLAVASVALPATADAAAWRNVARASGHGSWSYADASADSLAHRRVRVQTIGYHTGSIRVDWSASCSSGWNSNSSAGHYRTTAGVHQHAISLPNGGDCYVDAVTFLENGGSLTLRIQQHT